MVNNKITKSSQLEKLLLLELTNKQFGKFPNLEYYETYQTLSKEEKDKIDYKISNEIHLIWSYINGKMLLINKKNVNSIFEYNDLIQPVSPIILKVAEEFDIKLKNELTLEFRNAIIMVFGQDFLDRFLYKIQ